MYICNICTIYTFFTCFAILFPCRICVLRSVFLFYGDLMDMAGIFALVFS